MSNPPHTRDRYSWFRHAWIRLHEPRIISVIYGAWWSLCLALGAYSTVRPPRSIEAAGGEFLMMLIAATLTIGGLVGVICVSRGTWWAERTAVWFVLMSFFGYVAIVGWIWHEGDGERGLQMLGLLGAMMFTSLRFYWVRKRPYSKERTATRTNDTSQ